jgi:CheY-like chemotaxis protein
MATVLLVDNDIAQLTANADALLAAGHQVFTAINGQEAIEELEWNQPDVLICASSMPLVDGWELVRQLRDDQRDRPLPVLFMGQSDDKELRLAAFRSGVDDYLPKPFDPEELVRRLDRVLGRSRVVERPGVAPTTCDVQGRLENFSSAAVMRLLASERKTGVLWLHRHGERVRVMFRAGEPVRTECNHDVALDWRECLAAVLGWRTGDFCFVEQTVHEHDQMHTTVVDLLDGMLPGLSFGRRA